MLTTFSILLGLVVAVVAIGLVWRWISNRHQAPCPTWLAWMLEGGILERWMGTRQTLDHLNLSPGQRVLEIGPGPGRLLIPASRRVLPGGDVVGLDIQPGMLARLTRRAAQEGIDNLTAIEGDAASPPLAPASFDVIFLCTVLGEIPDRAAALRHAFDALRPGGLLSITEMFGDPHYQSRGSVTRQAKAAGFEPEAIHGGFWRFTANFRKNPKETT